MRGIAERRNRLPKTSRRRLLCCSLLLCIVRYKHREGFMSQPTRREYGELDNAYDFFNEALFDGALPRCLITLQRRSRARGYFCGDRFVTWDGVEVTDEIALNPALFRSRTVE